MSDSDATIESTLIRDTLPEEATLAFGRGLNLQTQDLELGRIASVLVRGCAIERSLEVGIQAYDANTTIESTWVHDTNPRASDNKLGFGISFSSTPGIVTQSSLVGALIERSFEAGLAVVSSTASIDTSVIAETRSNDGLVGDALAIVADAAPAAATVRNTSLFSSERAGIACFGCTATIAGVRIECAAFALSADQYNGSAPRFVDEGGNTCGCGSETAACKVLTPNLQPPEAPPH